MDIELISVETDLLPGKCSDTQTAYIMEKCAQIGSPVVGCMRVSRKNIHLADMIQAALDRTSVIMVLCMDCEDLELVRAVIAGKVLKQEDAQKADTDMVLECHGGTCSGLVMHKKDKTAILLPGNEEDLHGIFEKELLKMLQKEQKDIVYSATVKICGKQESAAKKLSAEILKKNPETDITVTACTGEVVVRIRTRAVEEHVAKKTLKPVLKAFLEKFGDQVYTTDDAVTLEASVLSLLKERDLTLTTAESLTGGLLAARFTAVPGASEVFKQGFVTYCNRAKRKLLEVKKTTLKEYGAVSERTAKEMAKNGVFATGSDVCISLTGLAGPAAEEGKPVGLVYIGCCYKNRTVVREYQFKGNRSQIREQSAVSALLLLRECILADQ